jgi:hypothetical protein
VKEVLNAVEDGPGVSVKKAYRRVKAVVELENAAAPCRGTKSRTKAYLV